MDNFLRVQLERHLREDYGMIISDSELEEFQNILQECNGEEISKEDALREAINLITVLRIFSKPMTKAEFIEAHKRLMEIWQTAKKQGII